MRRVNNSIIMIVLLVLFLSACGKSGTNNETDSSTGSDTTTLNYEKFAIEADFSDFDLDDSWDEATATKITLSGGSASSNGKGATVDGSTVTITAEGTYVISGTLDDGQVIVDVLDTEKVKLVLNNAEINCSSSAPIYILNADKTVITLADDSENSISDGETYTYTDEENEEPNAAIYSKDDLTFNGSGSLTVDANFNNGITGKDDLKVVNGNITVNAVNNGITGKDSLLVKDGYLTVNAGGDGIKTNNQEEEEQGYIYIGGGIFDIISGEDGIQADTCMLVEDGEFNIQSGGGSGVSSTDSGSSWGSWGNDRMEDNSSSESNEASAKGIKAGVDLTINSGSIVIDSSDDAVHTNDTLTIEGGIIEITSGDDGLHADTDITINNGSIEINKSYEGIESAQININDGDIVIVASDDGLNSAGGSDSSALGGRPGQGGFSETGNYNININGGTINVDASGDGIDANGSIYLTGGEVIVFGPTNDGNGALDYGGSFTVTGGSIIAAGSSGMIQTISDASSQYCISINFSSSQSAGTTTVIKDESGEEILSVTPSKAYQSLVVSLPEIKKGGTYSIYADGNLVDTCTVSSIVTTVGTTAKNNMGGQPGVR